MITAVDEKLRRDVLDPKAVKMMLEGCDHYAVLAKIKAKGRWGYGRENGKGKVSKVLASEKMDDRKEVKLRGI